MYVPNEDSLRKLILDEFHISHYTGHLGYQKNGHRTSEGILLAKNEEGCS